MLPERSALLASCHSGARTQSVGKTDFKKDAVRWQAGFQEGRSPLPVGRRSSHSGVSIMSTSLLVAKERQPGSPFGLGQKQAKNLWRKRATVAPYFEKYGANAPQLRAIRCSIDFC